MKRIYSCDTCLNKGSEQCIKCVSNGSDPHAIPSHWRPKLIPVEEDMVNHPNHYKTKSGLETIAVIEAFTEDLQGFEAVYTGNVLKYICRWKKKNGLQDLKKAQWYLNRLIEKVEEKEKTK